MTHVACTPAKTAAASRECISCGRAAYSCTTTLPAVRPLPHDLTATNAPVRTGAAASETCPPAIALFWPARPAPPLLLAPPVTAASALKPKRSGPPLAVTRGEAATWAGSTVPAVGFLRCGEAAGALVTFICPSLRAGH